MSYHFESKPYYFDLSSYSSSDAGSNFPERYYFENPVYTAATRTFNGRYTYKEVI